MQTGFLESRAKGVALTFRAPDGSLDVDLSVSESDSLRRAVPGPI